MISELIHFLIIALFFAIIYIVLGKFLTDGRIMQIVGLVMGLVLLLIAADMFLVGGSGVHTSLLR